MSPNEFEKVYASKIMASAAYAPVWAAGMSAQQKNTIKKIELPLVIKQTDLYSIIVSSSCKIKFDIPFLKRHQYCDLISTFSAYSNLDPQGICGFFNRGRKA